MRVAAQAVVILTQDEHDFAVGLESDHAIGDMDAVLLHAVGPADIRRLIESRLELDRDRHLFAVVGRIQQVVDDA